MDTGYKKLYRSQNERMIAGVCGGLAEYFNIDPTIVRLAFVAAALMGGPGLIVYLVMLVVVPEAPGGAAEYTPAEAESEVIEADASDPE